MRSAGRLGGARRSSGCRARRRASPRVGPASFPVFRRAPGRSFGRSRPVTTVPGSTLRWGRRNRRPEPRSCAALSGMPSSGISRPMTTGNLMADCERWCRDNLRPPRGAGCERDDAPPGRRSGGCPAGLTPRQLPARPRLAGHSGRAHRQLNPAVAAGAGTTSASDPPIRPGQGCGMAASWHQVAVMRRSPRRSRRSRMFR